MAAKKPVTDEQFVSAWQAADSQTEVARKLGVSSATVHCRAVKLRWRGVRLKALDGRFNRGASVEVDADAVREICKR